MEKSSKIYQMFDADVAVIKIQSSSFFAECFTLALTMNDRVMLLKLFYMNNGCIIKAIRKFQKFKSEIKRSAITVNGLRNGLLNSKR